MMELQKLLDKRAKLLKDMRALLDSAGDKGLSGEKEQQYNRMEEDFEALDKQIKALQKLEEASAQLSKPTTEPIVTEPSAIAKGDGGAFKAAFESYVRGEDPSKWMNAMTTLTGEDGGYVVPEEHQRTIVKKLHQISRTRNISKVIQTASLRNIPLEGDAPAFAWIDEGGAYGETQSTFGKTQLGAWKLGGIIKVSEELLKDSMIDLEDYLAGQIALGIDKAEAPAFATGDGNKKPTGYATGLGGVTLASKDGITGDELIDIYYSFKEEYRTRATWRLHDSTMKTIRKLKDGNGNYIYAPALVMGERDMILGRPIVTDDYLPELGATSVPVVVFGDFGYYTIADRGNIEIQRLNELYAANGYIGFKVHKRVDAKRVLDEAFTAAVTPSA